MKVYLCDWKYKASTQAKSDWFVALSAAFPKSFFPARATFEVAPSKKHDAYSNANAVLFVHAPLIVGSPLWIQWRNKAREVECHIVLVRSIGGQPGENDKGAPNFHGCHWKPEDFKACNYVNSPREVTRFVEQVNAGVPDKIDWNLLQPLPEPLLALSILCEAWYLTGRRKPGTAGAIAVRAPAKPEEWFVPFGMTSGNPHPKAAKEIAKLMGDAESEAGSLLKAVSKPPSDDVREAINALLSQAWSPRTEPA